MAEATSDATLRQIAAADPARSTWLTANAGSGKTRVLTDRVARLLLNGTRPERVLCLTYTKAAATEMQNRLLQRLGEWAMLPADELHATLRELGAGEVSDLGAARRLFAQAIETPGGLKVQTIHSFCASLLRRFPLEAGVPHGFTELDDRSASLLRAEVLEEMAEQGAAEMADITAITSGERVDSLLAELTRNFTADPTLAGMRAAAALPEGLTDDGLVRNVLTGTEAEMFRAMIPALLGSGSNDRKLAAALLRGNWDNPSSTELELLEGALLFGASAKAPFAPKIGGIPTKALQSGPCAAYMDDLNALMQRVADARPLRVAINFVNRSAALHRFARAFAARYEARKAAAGWLDFDDLIMRAGQLLSDAAMAQWVLFRLDGGIDHILVDEAQDTSPEQWRVVERLTAEFTTGVSDRLRTLFVVGDPKQSIYSFQGADIAVFESRRDQFGEAFAMVEQPMQRLDLEYSFRSSPAILGAVDSTFAGDAGLGLGQESRHRAFHSGRPGRVDLWPVAEAPPSPEETPWEDPVDRLAPDAAPTRLAEEIARQVSAMLDPDTGTSITTRSGEIRRMTAGDILILVQGRRSPLFGEIIRALKAAELPVAGADRLRLAAELAVKDIRALLNFLATPEDDLSLAALLRSPLIGLDEDALYRLAHGRGEREFLWARLRNSHHDEARAMLGDMIDNSMLRPFDLISRLLNRHGGRERLLARLGPEAEDGIDELLTQALAYERTEVPSLTGFLVWLSADEVEVRRQPGSGAGLIRVMTVHGSKGLESPVVILPDTHKRQSSRPPEVLRPKGGEPMLAGRADARPPFAQDAVAEAARLNAEERKRLLYVAMTRAESWLIVAAAGEIGERGESWYGMVRDGLEGSGLAETTQQGGLGDIRRFSFGDWPAAPPPATAATAAVVGEDAPWLWTNPPPVLPRRLPMTASALGGAKALPGPDGDDPEAAMLFGTRLHLLLEQLPALPRTEWQARARDLLVAGEGGMPDGPMLARLIDDASAVLDAPALSEVFTPPEGAKILTEAELSAKLPGIGLMRGIADRLIVSDQGVSVIDFKTNATVPARPEDTPVGILRQMAAYRAALAGIYPDRPVTAGVLWTATRELMWLPDTLLDQAMAALDLTRDGT
ncbi:double-strand break repair helicase AddA [Paracoccus aurantiacus]|uniref:DNA 3'-5' helicase n=1 Tax=Paracoccus aurantiacus TaxID=2599412 RepID=A0A5C6S085_9RHOB|nr:double-strand break repair helicase AddA [Paracoccus aurantiacus]TXB67807.1 double-strand break repair helicase AddA [Paracoccus aurantiacus]